MKEFFYSPVEKILFYIPDYYLDSNSSVNAFVESLTINADKLVKSLESLSGKLKEVKSAFIEESRRYKRMRVFWIENIETPPQEAFVLNEEWTMWKWLNN